MKSSLLVLILLLCGLRAVRADDFIEADTKLIFPEHCGAWTRESNRRFPDPQLGVGVNYRGADKRLITFYVYAGGHPKVPSGGEGELMAGELAEVIAGVEASWSKQKAARVRLVVGPAVARDAAGHVFARLSGQAIGAEDERLVSLSAVTGYRNRVLKVRYTFPGEDVNGGFGELAGLVGELLQANRQGLDPFFAPALSGFADTPTFNQTP